MSSAEFIVPAETAGVRLDQFLAGHVPALSRSRIQELIRTGHVTLNAAAAKPNARLRPQDAIVLTEPPAVAIDTLPQEIALAVIFEDEDFIVVNKPPGMVVHPAAGNWDGTLVNALLHHCKTLSGIGGEQRPGIVHRLDKDTSGCIVAAKNDRAHQSLSAQFAGREVTKIYLALASGHLATKLGSIREPIGRHPVERKKMTVVSDPAKGRTARTDWKVLAEIGAGSLVECTLHTGRTHQIRVHLKHLGHPLLGDTVYGRAAGFPRQMLHSFKLGFTHPRTGERMLFRAAVPPDFVAAGVSSNLL